MFDELVKINEKPGPFAFHTARDLWTDPHTSARMLAFHLDGAVDVSSRNTRFIERSVAWMADRFGPPAEIRAADFGCGPGLYANRLAARGAKVTGIDFSARSIAHAREAAAAAGLAVRYVEEDYLGFETEERFDLVLLIMCDLCALGPAQRKLLLTKFRSMLEPEGAVLLDVYSLAAFSRRREEARCEENLLDGFWSPERYFGFLHVFRYEAEKAVLDKYAIVEARRTRTVYNWLQYFSPETLAAELEAAGLAVEELLGDVAGGPYDPAADEFAIIARRA